VENLLMTLVSFTDTIMVGWLRSSAALAAVAMGGFLNLILTQLFAALVVAATSLVARSWGAGEYKKSRIYLEQGLFLAVVIGFLVAISGFFLSSTILGLMGLQGEALEKGTFYFRLIVLVNFLAFPAQMLFGTLRGSGDTRTPMLINGLANVLHIILAFILIYGWGIVSPMGVAGAAWATAIATGISSLIVIALVKWGKGEFYFSLKGLMPEKNLLRELTSLASPAFWEALVFRGAQVVFMRFVSALGEVALAAHQVALSIESLSYMPGWGFAVASTTLGGQFVGARRPELAERSVMRTLRIGLSVLSSFGLVFLTFGDKIALLFGGTPQVLAQAGVAIRLGGLEQPGLAIFMIISGALRGTGDTRSPMIATLAGVFLGRLLLVYLLAFPLGLGLAGVWIATAFDWSLRAVISYYFFRKDFSSLDASGKAK
jgi:putative MATE family efflux protein